METIRCDEMTEADHDAQDRAIDVWEWERFCNGGRSGGWAESLTDELKK